MGKEQGLNLNDEKAAVLAEVMLKRRPDLFPAVFELKRDVSKTILDQVREALVLEIQESEGPVLELSDRVLFLESLIDWALGVRGDD